MRTLFIRSSNLPFSDRNSLSGLKKTNNIRKFSFKCPNCSACFHRICSNKIGLNDFEEYELTAKDLQQNNNENAQQFQQNTCPKCLRRAKLVSSSGGGLLSSSQSLLNVSPGNSQQMLWIMEEFL